MDDVDNTEEQIAKDTEAVDATPPSESAIDKLKTIISSTYAKVLLSLLLAGFLLWAALSTCSSSHPTNKHRYVIGIDPSWYPLQLQFRQRNMTAFVETIVKEISRKIGVQIDIVFSSPHSLFREFEKGKFDGIVSVQLPESVYAGSAPYITSLPIYRLGPVLIVNAHNTFKSLDEMAGKVVGLVGNARVDVNIGNYPDVVFSGYSNSPQAFADLNNQRIDGLIVDSLQAKSYAHGLYANKFIISDFNLTNEGIILILHKTKEAEHYMKLFDEELKQLRKEGLYANFIKAWHLSFE